MVDQFFQAGRAECQRLIALGLPVEIDKPLVPCPSCGSWIDGWNEAVRAHQATVGSKE